MIDVYDGTGTIDWQRVYGAGVRHAYIKCTEGILHNDGRCQANVVNARKAGIVVGLYHFAGSSVRKQLYPPHREAGWFLSHAEQLWRKGDLRPCLDLELSYGHDWGFLNDWKAQWFAAVDEACGARSVFYSYYYFWKQMQLYDDRPVWGAAYGSGFNPPHSWTLHQYSASGSVAGVVGRVDLSRRLPGASWPLIASLP